MNKIELLSHFYMWMKENDYDHNIWDRVERKADMFLHKISVGQKLPIHNVSHRSFPKNKLHLRQANGSRILEIRGRIIKDREVVINCTEHWEAEDPNYGSDERHDAAYFVNIEDIDKIITTLEEAKIFLNGG